MNYKKWINHEFSTGSSPGEDYKTFQREMKRDLKALCEKEGLQLHTFHPNHYEFSAVVTDGERFGYISISDVRYWKNEWFNKVLIRTMKHSKDWTGGNNYYYSWPDVYSQLTETEEDDPYDLEIMVDKTACNPHKFVHRRYCIKYFKEIFDSLSDKDKSLLGHCYGAFGYEEMTIKDIATLEMMTENSVKKAKKKAIEHFWELFPRSNFSVWIDAFHRVRMQIKYPDRRY